ncbi:hypothetical protein LIA77_09356 [Sarocladium implicatum]|nr:hypothetical protein LIA77_09356 [Sarocladium implicatum]
MNVVIHYKYSLVTWNTPWLSSCCSVTHRMFPFDWQVPNSRPICCLTCLKFSQHDVGIVVREPNHAFLHRRGAGATVALLSQTSASSQSLLQRPLGSASWGTKDHFIGLRLIVGVSRLLASGPPRHMCQLSPTCRHPFNPSSATRRPVEWWAWSIGIVSFETPRFEPCQSSIPDDPANYLATGFA